MKTPLFLSTLAVCAALAFLLWGCGRGIETVGQHRASPRSVTLAVSSAAGTCTLDLTDPQTGQCADAGVDVQGALSDPAVSANSDACFAKAQSIASLCNLPDNVMADYDDGNTLHFAVTHQSAPAWTPYAGPDHLVAPGIHRACAIQNGVPYCWGRAQSWGNGVDFLVQDPSCTDGGPCPITIDLSQPPPPAIPVDFAPVAQRMFAGSVDTIAGDFATCAIVSGGVQCYGDNQFGELGSAFPSALATTASPQWVYGLEAGRGVDTLTGGTTHLCALSGGGVRCWGRDVVGQLGDNTWQDRAFPVQTIAGNASTVVAAYDNTCAIMTGEPLNLSAPSPSADGGGYTYVSCWGDNRWGQAGLMSSVALTSPVAATNKPIPIVLESARGKIRLCAESAQYTGLGRAGTSVVCSRAVDAGWVANTCPAKQPCYFGNGTVPMMVLDTTGPVDLTVGGQHACALTGDTVYCWGDNESGQLATGTQVLDNIYSSTALPVHGLPAGVQKISAGTNHTCAIVNYGVWCWGGLIGAQLAADLGVQYQAVALPVLAWSAGVTDIMSGDAFTCAAVGGGVQCIGNGYWGSLGTGDAGSFWTVTTAPVSVVGISNFHPPIQAPPPNDGGAPWGGPQSGPPNITYPSAITFVANAPNAPVAPTGTGWGYFAVSPALPQGVALDPMTGVISCDNAPPYGSANYAVTITNLQGTQTVTFALDVSVPLPPPPSNLVYPPLVTCSTDGLDYEVGRPTVSGLVTWFTVTPALPDGVTLNPYDGSLECNRAWSAPAAAYTVTASNAGGSTTATLVFSVADAVPATGLIQLNSPSYNVDDTTGAFFTVSETDSNGNPIQFSAVTVGAYGLGSTQPTCDLTDTFGISRCYYSSTVAGVKSLSITSSTFSNSSPSVDLTVLPGAPNALLSTISNAISGGGTTIPADGATQGTVTITLLDQYRNPISGVVPTFSASGTGNTLGACTATDAFGTATCPISSTKAEVKALAIASPIVTPAYAMSTANFVLPAGATAPSNLTYPSLVVGGGNSALVMTCSTTANTPAMAIPTVYSGGGLPVTFSMVNGGPGSNYPPLPPGVVFDPATGSLGCVSPSPSALTFYTVMATNALGWTQVQVGVEVLQPPFDLVYSTPLTINQAVQGGEAPIAFTGALATFSVNPAFPAGVTLDPVTGLISWLNPAIAAMANYVVTATNLVGSVSTTVTLQVLPGDPTLANAMTGNSPISLDQFTGAFFPITVVDASGAPLAGVVPSIAVAPAPTQGPTCSATSPAGVAICSFHTTLPGTSTVSLASPAGASLGIASTASIVFTAGQVSAALSTVTGTSPVVADGTAVSNITITLVDQFGNGVAGVIPTFGATGSWSLVGPCSASTAQGISSCTLRSFVAETKGLMLVTPVPQFTPSSTVTFVYPPSGSLTLSGLPATVPASTCVGPLTLSSLDAQGNPKPQPNGLYVSIVAGQTNNVWLYLDSTPFGLNQQCLVPMAGGLGMSPGASSSPTFYMWTGPAGPFALDMTAWNMPGYTPAGMPDLVRAGTLQ